MAKRREMRFQYFDHKGGLNVKSNPLMMPLEDSPDLLNVDLTETGAIKKRTGWGRYSNAAIGTGGEVRGVFYLRKATGSQYMLVAEGDSLYEECPVHTFTTVRASGMHATNVWLGTEYHDNLYLANGYNFPQVYTGGANTTNLHDEVGASLPAAWALTDQPAGFMLTYPNRAERLAAWGVASDPSMVWFSDVQNPLEWAAGTAFNLLVLNDNGEPVKGVFPLYNYTIVFKETQTALYLGDDAGDVTLRQVYPVGCPSIRSIARVGKDLYFWSNKGPTRASGIEAFGDIAPINVSTKIESVIADCNWFRADQIVAVHDNSTNRIMWFYPKTGGVQNIGVLVYHYDVEAWSVYDDMSASSTLAVEGLGGKPQIYFGDYGGYLNISDETTNDNSVAYTGRYVTPWYDFGDFSRRDRILDINFAVGKAGYNADVYFQWDFQTDWALLGSLADMACGLDPAEWGDETWGDFVWGDGASVGAIKGHTCGSGKVFRMKFEDTTTDDLFHLLGWSFVVSPRGRR